jgi:hypothetical protein
MFARFVPTGETVAMLVRPDRYVAATFQAASDSLGAFAASCRTLAADTWPMLLSDSGVEPATGRRVDAFTPNS